MDVQALLEEIRGDPEYAGQIVHVRQIPGRPARHDASAETLSPELRDLLPALASQRALAEPISPAPMIMTSTRFIGGYSPEGAARRVLKARCCAPAV